MAPRNAADARLEAELNALLAADKTSPFPDVAVLVFLALGDAYLWATAADGSMVFWWFVVALFQAVKLVWGYHSDSYSVLKVPDAFTSPLFIRDFATLAACSGGLYWNVTSVSGGWLGVILWSLSVTVQLGFVIARFIDDTYAGAEEAV